MAYEIALVMFVNYLVGIFYTKEAITHKDWAYMIPSTIWYLSGSVWLIID